ncbi:MULTISPECIES: FtsX-like permease family protein [unclassified Kribbella]|uniref:FtsX-like permease family protein n=1 Tax=unclassified Kribbella TaxID=2644121 RepID=UPI003016A4BB
MGDWGPPLRIARRTTRRSLGRTFLVAALIGLPVLAATWMGVVLKTGNPTGEALARLNIGQADARVDVSQFGKLQPMDMPPVLGSSEPPPAQGSEKPVREPATFDPRPLLPVGTVLARKVVEVGTADIQGPSTTSTVNVMTGDAQSPLAKDTIRLDEGRFPASRSEVAISPSLAKYLGLKDFTGATVRAADGTSYQVVGIFRPTDSPQARTVLATPGTPLVAVDPTTSVQYLADLPDAVDATTLAGPLRNNGLFLLPRANIVDPPPDEYGMRSSDIGPYAAMALAISFGVLEIVLLAGTAFAVGARRQTRELGLVMATGGTARDVRRIVLLQGLFAGVVGVTGGLLLAAVVLIVGRPLWERISSTLFLSWQVPWVPVIVIAVLGVLAGLAAAVVPAVSAGRQAPLAALAGRFAATIGKAKVRKPAVLMVIAGVALVLAGSTMLAAALAEAKRAVPDGSGSQATVTPTGPITLVLLGITAVIAGLVWLLPSLVGKLSGLAGRLPLSGRLALRDAARHRHRTGPATAAIMMAVASTAAVAFAASNAIAADAKEYVPQGRSGNAIVEFGTGGSGSVPYSAATEQRLAALLPVRDTYRVGTITAPGVKPINDYLPTIFARAPETVLGNSGINLIVVDPAYVGKFAGLERAAAELRAGKIVLPSADLTTKDTVELISDTPTSSKRIDSHPAVYAGGVPKIVLLRDSALISPQEAAKFGSVNTIQVEYEFSSTPTKDALAAADRLLGRDDLLTIENGYQSPARMFLIGILTAATVVTLLGVAISVSLSAAEGRADLATLAAIGAQPRRRRNLAAAQAWVLGQLGCVLGVGVGALYGYTAHAAFGSPHFVVPWLEIGGIVIVVPLFAGLLAWLMTRSRLPMVSRID